MHVGKVVFLRESQLILKTKRPMNIYKIIKYKNVLLQLGMAYKGIFLLDETCEWLITEKDCLLYTEVLYVGISGMIYSQTGILIER